MDLTFSAEERAFRKEARGWLHDNKPRERRPPEGPAVRDYDLAWQRRQFEGGWAGIAWPVDYGGRGLSLIKQLIWYEEYANADAPPIGSLFVGLNHAGPTLIQSGSEAQKAAYLPGILRGDHIWCQGFSEPSSGSDLASLRTRAIIDGDYLVVTGQKIWTTFAYIADYQELLIRTDPDAPTRHKGLSWVICDMRSPGISVRPLKTMAGHVHFAEVFYDEVRIPIDSVVGRVNDGWSVAMATLSFERGPALIGHQKDVERVIAQARMLAQTTLDDDGRPLIANGAVAERLAGLMAEAAGVRALSYALVSRANRAQAGSDATVVALAFGELAQRAHLLVLDILGASALDRSTNDTLVTSYFDAFRHTIAGGTSEIRRNIIGERLLGLPR